MERKIIELAITDEYSVDLHTFEDMPIVTYVSYEDSELYFSVDSTTLVFKHYMENNIKLDSVTALMDKLKEIGEEEILKYRDMIRDHYYKCLQEDDPVRALVYHNKRDKVRQVYLILMNGHFSPKAFYELLVDTYSHVEDGFETLVLMMEAYKMRHDEYVRKEVRKALRQHKGNVGGEVIVYRGFNKYSNPQGTSYTFDYEIAKFFANRWDSEGKVNEYKIKVKDILAYIPSKEDEVVSCKSTLLREDL